MDYEKEYKSLVAKIKKAYLFAQTDSTKNVLVDILPELSESEDERIRKFLVKHVSEWIGCIEHDLKLSKNDVESENELAMFKAGLAYLERQKEPENVSASTKIPFCWEVEKKDIPLNGDADLYFDSWTQHNDVTKRGCFKEGIRYAQRLQKEKKPAEWKPLPESMEALLLAIEGKWDEIKPTGYMSRRLEDLYDGLVNTFDVDEKYLGNLPKTEYTEKDIEEIKALKEKIDSSMETKPAEWSEDWCEEDIQTRFAFYTYKDDPSVLYLSNVFVEEASRNHGFGTRILRAAEKVAETIGAITISLKVKQDSPANAWYRKNGYGYVAFEDGYDWLEKNLEYLKPAKQEWSEEDESKLSTLLGMLTVMRELNSNDIIVGTHSKKDREKRFNEIETWLKSLRPQPHWKPSKEQIEALDDTIFFDKTVFRKKKLVSLLEDLKKLM